MQTVSLVGWLARRLPSFQRPSIPCCLGIRLFSTSPTFDVEKGSPWNQAELDQLLELRKQGKPLRVLCSMLPQRSEAAIRSALTRHSPRDEHGKQLYQDSSLFPQSDLEQILKLRAARMSYRTIQSDYFPNRTIDSLECAANTANSYNRRGSRTPERRWSPEDIQRVHDLRMKEKLPWKEVARIMERSYGSVTAVFKNARDPNAKSNFRGWDSGARQQALRMIQSGKSLSDVATSVYPDKDPDVVHKYLFLMYKNFRHRSH